MAVEMEYEGRVYRPPSEADSLILQATLGCSYNGCTFCGMYRDKPFRIRPIAELREEIRWARDNLGTVRKVFLGDGDALIAKASFLHLILDELREAFPGLRRVSIYASPQSINVRSVEEMISLREAGLTLYYLGIESGHDEVLLRLNKGVDAGEMIACGRKVGEAGVRLSTMILLGAGGRALSLQHAGESARVVNAIRPRFVSTLVLTPVPESPLWEAEQKGEFDHLTPVELAHELRAFVAALELDGAIFRSNHASNYLSLAGTLPKDKQRMLARLDNVLSDPDSAPFRPDWMRGL
jgi:radical SAM superfamily enzyme YgiQ (UPF0313 family)